MLEKLKDLYADLAFQLGFAEQAKTNNVCITKDQGYMVLSMTEYFIKKAESKEKTND